MKLRGYLALMVAEVINLKPVQPHELVTTLEETLLVC
jgi:hypothetical protein